MQRPFELSSNELRARLEEMVQITTSDLVSEFLLMPMGRVALHSTGVKLTCNENGVQTYSSWYASTHSQEDYHGPHNNILPQ